MSTVSGGGPSGARARIAVMLSGGGRTLENLIACIARGELDAEIAVVIASRECRGAEIGREAGIETRVMAGEIEARELGEVLRGAGASWVALAGYLRRVQIPDGFEGRIVNIHPALLPAFGGRGMHGMRVHEAVVEAARAGLISETGCTVHVCTAEYDEGPIVLQARCPVSASDTADEVAARVFELEKAAYPEALRRLIGAG